MAEKENSELNLYQKLLKITEEIGKIEKTGYNKNQGYNFIEASNIAVHVKAQLVAYGVAIVPSLTRHEIIPKEKGVKALVEVEYTLINVDHPTEQRVCRWPGEGDDSLDKATSKAGTSNQKYFYMRLFNISDKDDPDAESPEIGKAKPVEVQDDPPAPTNLNAEQVSKLMSLAKMKGCKTKEDAITFINGALLVADFTTLNPKDFDEYKTRLSDPKLQWTVGEAADIEPEIP